MLLEDLLWKLGFKIILPDITIDQIRIEESGYHKDNSENEFEVAITCDGFIMKCLFCGIILERNESGSDTIC